MVISACERANQRQEALRLFASMQNTNQNLVLKNHVLIQVWRCWKNIVFLILGDGFKHLFYVDVHPDP